MVGQRCVTVAKIAITFAPMADVFSKAKRSRVMAAIRSKGNKETELRLARIFRHYRITGWRRHQPVTGKPDFIFRRQKLAVFVDGCFWHGCPRCYHRPKSNRKYWDAKIIRNRARDRYVTKALRQRGWRIIRIWEHELGVAEFQTVMRVAKSLGLTATTCDNGAKLPTSRK
jgi:DNA mismatch endonuclease (patch repair protein)